MEGRTWSVVGPAHGWQFGSHDCVETGKTSFEVNILICAI